jgi:hypothetical protein
MTPGTDKWIGSDFDLAILAVQAPNPRAPVYGPKFAHCRRQRYLLQGQIVPLLISDVEKATALIGAHHADLVETLAQQALRWLVEIEPLTGFVRDERRHGQAGRKLTHQDQPYIALRHARIVAGPVAEDEGATSRWREDVRVIADQAAVLKATWDHRGQTETPSEEVGGRLWTGTGWWRRRCSHRRTVRMFVMEWRPAQLPSPVAWFAK